MRHDERALYVISVAAELAGVHPQTLRIYERKGLVDPARTAGGNRRYSDADIAHLRRIQELTAEGLNLAGVETVLELEGKLARARAELAAMRERAAELEARMAEEIERVSRAVRAELVPYDAYGKRDLVVSRLSREEGRRSG